MVNKGIIWVSANKFGYELLREAIKQSKSDIKAIITLSKKSRIIMYDGIKRQKWHNFRGIDVYEVSSINTKEKLLQRLSPDLLCICGWREIIDEKILEIPRYGTVGLHPTLLPLGRGSAPIINSILQGIRQSGVTMFYLDKDLDKGDIIGQEKFMIEEEDYAEDVYHKVVSAGKKLIKKYLFLVAKGKASRRPQDNSKATYFKKLRLSSNKIDFEKESAEQIYRKIRALSYPYRGAYFKKNNKKIIIWRAELKEQGEK